MKIAKKFEICTGHRLSNYEGKCKDFHGHNYVGELIIEADTLNDLGMVEDFSWIKQIIKNVIDFKFDHKMILKSGDPLNEATKKLWEEMGNYSAVMVDYNPTVENIIGDIKKTIQDSMINARKDYKISLVVYETSTSYASTD